MNAIQTLQFQDTQFTITDLNGKPWLRGYQIGNALQYSDGAVAIAKLYERNADEFTESMTQVVELQTAGVCKRFGFSVYAAATYNKTQLYTAGFLFYDLFYVA